MKTRTYCASGFIFSLAIAAAACGGEKKPAESPEINAGITETSMQEDMPPPPAKEGDVAAPAETTEGPGAAGGMMKLSAMKLTPVKKSKTDKPIEVKDDGSVLIDGKPAATIKGDQVDSSGGTSMLTIGVDGSLVGNGVKAGYKFEGDDLVHESGMKLSVAEDGTITASKDGKSEPVAMTEGGAATAKRAALVAAVLWMTIPTTITGDAKAKPTTNAAGADAKPKTNAAGADAKPTK